MTAPNCGVGHDPERISCETAGELVRLRAEVERLRARTHEIQAQEMAKRAALDSELTRWRTMFATAEQWTEQVGLTADWAIDPTLPFWRMTSYATRAALMRLVADRDEARAQVAAVRGLCRGAMRLPTMDNPRPADDRVSPRAVLAALDGVTR